MIAHLIAVALAVIAYALSGILYRLYHIYVSPTPELPPGGEASILRIALLGAASIAPHALLYPARSIPEIAVVAVGARSADRARALAEKWDIKLYGTYEQILSSDQVDAVYIGLINGMHYQWAEAALRAGKHVLCEKPLTSNAHEARELERLARQRSLVLMEAYHNLHHPLATRMRELVRSGELGELTELRIGSGLPGPDGFAALIRDKLSVAPPVAPAGATAQPSGTPRRKAKMDVSLGGGKFLGQGCYTVSMARWLLGDGDGALPTVESARMVEDVPGSRADVATDAVLRFGSGVRVHVYHSSFGPGFDLTATFTRGSFTARNYLFPWVYHHLAVTATQADGMNATTRVEQHYEQRSPTAADPTGCASLVRRRMWWGAALWGQAYSCDRGDAAQSSSFALQLRAFATAVRLHGLRAAQGEGDAFGGARGEDEAQAREAARLQATLRADPSSWALEATSAASAVRNMEILDNIYDASGLGARPGRA